MHEEKVLDQSSASLRRGMSRGEFLKISGASLAGLALLGVAAPAFANEDGMISARDLGITPNNSSAAIQNRENIVKALKFSRKNVVFAPGDYYIDNSTAQPDRGLNPNKHVVIYKYEGQLTMESGARFVFTDKRRRGFHFYEGTGARFRGLRGTFKSPLPDTRVNGNPCVLFERTTDTVVEDVEINGSPGSGLLFNKCIRPSVTRATIRNTMADGLHIANCKDSKVRNLLTDNTGDDGLAFINFANEGDPDYSGGYATNITVRNGGTRGIVVAGQSDVVVEHFEVDNVYFTGVLIFRDSYWNTRIPSDVTIAHGTIRNAGKGPRGTGSGNSGKYGIQFSETRSAKFKDIKVVDAVSRGITGSTPHGTVELKGITCTGAGGPGFNLTAKNLILDDLTARDSKGAGIVIMNSETVKYGNLTSVNTSKADTLRRAFWFEHNKRVNGKELYVVDEQRNPTGYKLSTYGTQSGCLGNVHDRVKNGKCRVENQSDLKMSFSPT